MHRQSSSDRGLAPDKASYKKRISRKVFMGKQGEHCYYTILDLWFVHSGATTWAKIYCFFVKLGHTCIVGQPLYVCVRICAKLPVCSSICQFRVSYQCVQNHSSMFSWNFFLISFLLLLAFIWTTDALFDRFLFTLVEFLSFTCAFVVVLR